MQTEFNFSDSSGSESGFSLWRETRRQEQIALARRLGLPLGAQVDVWLRGGIRLRGILKLSEELLLNSEAALGKTPFEVSGVSFRIEEMESCVKQD